MALRAYASAVASAVRHGSSSDLISHLAFNDSLASTAVFEMRGNAIIKQLTALVEDRLHGVDNPQKWAEVVAYHLSSIRRIQKNEMQEAFDDYLKAAKAFREIFDKETDPWLDRPMVVVIKNLRAVADQAHKVKRQQGEHSEIMNLAGEEIRRALKCASQGQKAPAVLPIIVILYKLYFKIGNMRLSKELSVMIRAPLHTYPLGEQVAFMFFKGVLKVMEESWTEAQKSLEEAFRNCNPSSPKNKAVILSYLVPVNMLLGIMPRVEMLQRHKLTYFIPIVEAIKTGNPVALRDALVENQYRFIQAGTYLLMEKLYLTTYRMLVKRVHLIQQELDPNKPKNQVYLEYVQRALSTLGEEMHIDEVECIVANLISRKYIKGYVSHNYHRLVVDKTMAYPPLDRVQLA